MTVSQDDALPGTWKAYVRAGVQFLAVFYLASFCLGMLFLHRGEHWYLQGIFLGLLYLFIVVYSVVRMIKKLSMAAIMVASPTIPLCMLLIVVSLLPTLQALDKRKAHDYHPLNQTQRI